LSSVRLASGVGEHDKNTVQTSGKLLCRFDFLKEPEVGLELSEGEPPLDTFRDKEKRFPLRIFCS